MTTLGFQKIGFGPHKVVALHGWFGDHTTFDAMHNALSHEEFTYIFPAYRGYGLSRELTGRLTIEEMASDVITLADDLGWETFSIIGHSMSGKVAQRVIVDFRSRVRKVVAVTAVSAHAVPFDAEGRKLFEGAAHSVENRKVILGSSTGNRLTKAWIERTARHSLKTVTIDAFAGYFEAWSKTDFASEVVGSGVAIKIIVGEHDPVLTEEVMRQTYLTQFPDAELEVMPNTGHYPMDETPIALTASIEAFLRK
ncbi:alpha/beta hydrolase [Paraburkholderia sediminicola]|uniref:alpha/beta fold hydrolase n=1 Tax=Paraburkholderia sediminicola TaxID=458836 RepID=UPI0038B9D8F7